MCVRVRLLKKFCFWHICLSHFKFYSMLDAFQYCYGMVFVVLLGRVKRKNARKAAGGGGDDDED